MADRPAVPTSWRDARSGAVRRTAGLAVVVEAFIAPAVASPASGQPVPPACPARAVTTRPAPHWAPTRRTLAPAGAVAIRLCRHSGLNAHPRLALTRTRTLTGASRVAALARDLNRLPAGPSGGSVACPNDDESQVLAILSYPAGRSVRITLGLAGCNALTNGIVRRTAAGLGSPRFFGPQLLAELKRLTG